MIWFGFSVVRNTTFGSNDYCSNFSHLASTFLFQWPFIHSAVAQGVPHISALTLGDCNFLRGLMWLLLLSFTMALISQIPQTSVSCSCMPLFALDYLHLEPLSSNHISRTLELFSVRTWFSFCCKATRSRFANSSLRSCTQFASGHESSCFHGCQMIWFVFSVVRNVTVIFTDYSFGSWPSRTHIVFQISDDWIH